MSARGVKIRWRARNLDSGLEEAAQLSLEESGALSRVIDLIYLSCNNLHDNDRFIAGHCRCDLRVWRRIKARLMALGFLYVDAATSPTRLRNAEADDGVAEALARISANAKAGLKSGVVRASRSRSQNNNVNDLARTPVPTGVATYGPTNNSNKNKDLSISASAAGGGSSPRAPDGAAVAARLGPAGEKLRRSLGDAKLVTWFADAEINGQQVIAGSLMKAKWIHDNFPKELDTALPDGWHVLDRATAARAAT